MSTSFYINGTDTNGKKIQRSVTDIDSNANNYQIVALAKGLFALTSNTYSGTTKIIREDIAFSADDPQFWLEPTKIKNSQINGGKQVEITLHYLGNTRSVSVNKQSYDDVTISGENTKTVIIKGKDDSMYVGGSDDFIFTLPASGDYKASTASVHISD